MRKDLIAGGIETVSMAEGEDVWRTACSDAVRILGIVEAMGVTPKRLFLALAIIVAAVLMPAGDDEFKEICKALVTDSTSIREALKKAKEAGLLDTFKGGDLLV